MFIALDRSTGRRVSALGAGGIEHLRARDLACPLTGAPVVPVRHHLRKDAPVQQHFRYRHDKDGMKWPADVEFDPDYGSLRDGRFYCNESWQHAAGKLLVAERWPAISGTEGRCEFEHTVTMPSGRKRRIDVAFLYPSGVIVAHEVQRSPITRDELEQRYRDYLSLGIQSGWWLFRRTASPAVVDFLAQQAEHGQPAFLAEADEPPPPPPGPDEYEDDDDCD